MVTVTQNGTGGSFLKASKGCLYRRGKMYWFKASIDGERRHKALKTNRQEEALRLARLMQEQLTAGINPFLIREAAASGVATFPAFCDEYLAYSKANKSGRSHQRDQGIIKKLRDHFRQDLGRITRRDIERYLEGRRGKGKAPGTINKELNLIHAILNKAVDREYLVQNPARGIKKLQEQPKDVPRVTNEIVAAVLAKAPPFYAAAIKVSLETGVRAGELLRLRWADIGKDQVKITDTKTYRHRYVPISSRLRKVLKDIPHKADHLFPISEHRMKHMVSLICKDAGFSNITSHTFRHEYGSRLVEAGVDIRKVQELMGHRNIRTTMRYLHLAPGYMKGLGEKLGYDYSVK